MNVILKISHGVVDTPFLVKHRAAADAQYRNIVDSILGEDYFYDYEWLSDGIHEQVNAALAGLGQEVIFFEDVEVNKYKNK